MKSPTTKLAVYVAAKYSLGDRQQNTWDAMGYCHRLHELGFTWFCPHLSHYVDQRHPKSWDEWMDHCLQWVRRCDVLLRMPGESRGADMEVSFAIALGMEVFRSIEELAEWAHEERISER